MYASDARSPKKDSEIFRETFAQLRKFASNSTNCIISFDLVSAFFHPPNRRTRAFSSRNSNRTSSSPVAQCNIGIHRQPASMFPTTRRHGLAINLQIPDLCLVPTSRTTQEPNNLAAFRDIDDAAAAYELDQGDRISVPVVQLIQL